MFTYVVHEIQKDLQENKKATLVEDKIPLIQCNICEKNSKPKKYYINIWKKFMKKKYKCQYCGFEFAKSGHLSRHMKIHEDEETKLKK